MTRYNRFHNMKNDSTLHDIMTSGLVKPPVPAHAFTTVAYRNESCDISDNDMRSQSRNDRKSAINKRNESTFNVINGQEKVEMPVSFSKKMFPEKEVSKTNPILQQNSPGKLPRSQTSRPVTPSYHSVIKQHLPQVDEDVITERRYLPMVSMTEGNLPHKMIVPPLEINKR